MTTNGGTTPHSALRHSTALAYAEFATLQHQKLMALDYLNRRRNEIDDPAAISKRLLAERYPHLSTSHFDALIDDLAERTADLLSETPTQTEVVSSTSVSGAGDLHREAVDEFASQFTSLIAAHEQSVGVGYIQLAVGVYLRAFLESYGRENSADVRASLYTALIADFEAMVSRVITHLLLDNPAALGPNDRNIPWLDLVAADSVRELRQDIIDNAVVDVMRGTFDDWIKFLKTKFAIDMTSYTESSEINEMFQRRHVLIHNGSRASRLYVAKCAGTDVKPGDLLDVSDEYFQR